ncbi:MAG: 30S ribosomal protein S12 methylthiotransferase RimO, partial [Oscillospiraceae bacterium]
MYKIGMISLGCPKNQVDAELMLAKLEQEGFEIVNDAVGADAVIVNTCGFIDDAKKEAIENILEMAQLKEDGELKKLIVTGCLAERYKQEVL